MRVFISSTSEDLQAYRLAARDVVHNLGLTPVNMEDFGPDGEAAIVQTVDINKQSIYRGHLFLPISWFMLCGSTIGSA